MEAFLKSMTQREPNIIVARIYMSEFTRLFLTVYRLGFSLQASFRAIENNVDRLWLSNTYLKGQKHALYFIIQKPSSRAHFTFLRQDLILIAIANVIKRTFKAGTHVHRIFLNSSGNLGTILTRISFLINLNLG